MAKKERLRRRKNRRILRLGFVIGIIIYFLFRLVPTLHSGNAETYTVVDGKLTFSSPTEGIVIKKEQVFDAVGYGKLTAFVEEGERVSVGTKIADLNLTQSVNFVSNELDRINQQIKMIEQQTLSIKESQKGTARDKGYDENNIISQIKQAITSNDYEEVKKLKKDLINHVANKDTNDNYERYQDLEGLLEQKSTLLKSKKEGNHTYIAQTSGVISFKIDGFEKMYTPSNMTQITYETFPQMQQENEKPNLSVDVKYGQPVYKMCDNYKWYIATKVNLESMDYLSVGKNVNVKLEVNKEPIKGTVEHITASKNGAVAILSFTTDFYKFYDKRYVNIEVIYKEQEGLKIPKKAIDTLEGIDGVYQKKMNKIIQFRPVQKLFEDEEYAIVKSGYIEVKAGKETREVKTIDRYDEIILNIESIDKEHIIR